jgi:hypothetical protein
MQVRFLPAGPRKQCDEAREDHERQELERKLFEAYAETKGYNLTRIAINKFDVSKSAYKNDVVDAEWQGWKARADLHAALESTPKPRKSKAK